MPFTEYERYKFVENDAFIRLYVDWVLNSWPVCCLNAGDLIQMVSQMWYNSIRYSDRLDTKKGLMT